MPPRRILIADPDPASAELLEAVLRRRGYRVQVASDSPRALELAVLRTPDLVVLDVRSPLLDARTFVRILRKNPRTEGIPVLVIGQGERTSPLVPSGVVDPAEVLSRVERIFRRAEASEIEAGLEGDLAQLPLADLLQILAVNRRSGRLLLGRDGARGEIALAGGHIIDATAGPVTGEKALGRLLSVREGPFAFVAGSVPGAMRIARRVEELILDGLRQVDEMAALSRELPPPDQRLALAIAASAVPEGLLPVTSEVLALLGRPCTLTELLDRGTASDLELMRALAVLVKRGLVRRLSPAGREGEASAVFSAAVREALRSRLSSGPGRGLSRGKVVLCGGGPLTRRAALSRFGALPGFTVEAPGAPVEQGTLGTLEVGEGVRLDLVALPSDPGLFPLWRLLAAGALGALVLAPAEELERALRFLEHLKLAVFACGPAPAQPSESYLGADPAEALRALLERTAQSA